MNYFSVLSTMSDESPRRINFSSPPASSFVYPVRSLLSAIQPAATPKSRSTVSSFFCLGNSELHRFRFAPDTNSHAPENLQILTAGLVEANDKLKEECDFTCANQSIESGELLGTTQSRQKISCMSHVSSSSSRFFSYTNPTSLPFSKPCWLLTTRRIRYFRQNVFLAKKPSLFRRGERPKFFPDFL